MRIESSGTVLYHFYSYYNYPCTVIPSITLECDTEVNETTGLISAESRWYIPRHEEYSTVANAIDFYTVNYTWVEASTGLPLLEVTSKNVFPNQVCMQGGREGGREGEKDGGREGGREGTHKLLMMSYIVLCI